MKTYHRFKDHNVMSPKRILETKWEELVKILDEGGYTCYDYKTADKLVVVAGNLLNVYCGKLSKIHEAASDSRDLELKLKSLGKGIGNVTVNIFLRDLRGLWKKADPYPTALEILAAERLEILQKGMDGEEALKKLKRFWGVHRIPGKIFLNLETALVRLGKEYRKAMRQTRNSGAILSARAFH